MEHLKAIGKAAEKGIKPFLNEDEWWAQLPDSRKKAIQKAADKLAVIVPDGAAVDPLKFLKLEAGAISEDDG